MLRRRILFLCLLAVGWLSAPAALAAGDARTAALQVALRSRRLYGGAVDGMRGPATVAAVLRFQRRAHLEVDGVVGPQTRAALGRFARHPLGSRWLAESKRGWDVAELQFLLAWHGFPCGTFDGTFGLRTGEAVRRFQRWAGLPAVGVAGPATIAALQAPPPRSPMALSWPLTAPVGDTFGPRGSRFHAGIDLPSGTGTPVGSAAPGRVTYAGPRAGGWGLLVVVAHQEGVRTLYAHLSEISVQVGDEVAAGDRLGLVGATGHATGPHLHFEVRVRGAAVDPLSALP